MSNYKLRNNPCMGSLLSYQQERMRAMLNKMRALASAPTETISEIITEIPTEGMPVYKPFLTMEMVKEKALEKVAIAEQAEYETLRARFPKIESLSEGQHVAYFYDNTNQFIQDVHGAWAALKAHQEKADYLTIVHNWILKNVDPDDYQYLYPNVPWNWVYWFVAKVMHEHGEYAQMIYIRNDITAYIRDVTNANLQLQEEQREGHREAVKTYLDQWAPQGFAEQLPADLQKQFIETFFPSELAAVAEAQAAEISQGRIMGIVIAGAIGITLLMAIGGRRRSAKA